MIIKRVNTFIIGLILLLALITCLMSITNNIHASNRINSKTNVYAQDDPTIDNVDVTKKPVSNKPKPTPTITP
jgi:hypothetical protein